MFTGPKQYPRWSSAAVWLPRQLVPSYPNYISYKYVKMINGNTIWEDGSNRILYVYSFDYVQSLTVSDESFCGQASYLDGK